MAAGDEDYVVAGTRDYEIDTIQSEGELELVGGERDSTGRKSSTEAPKSARTGKEKKKGKKRRDEKAKKKINKNDPITLKVKGPKLSKSQIAARERRAAEEAEKKAEMIQNWKRRLAIAVLFTASLLCFFLGVLPMLAPAMGMGAFRTTCTVDNVREEYGQSCAAPKPGHNAVCTKGTRALIALHYTPLNSGKDAYTTAYDTKTGVFSKGSKASFLIRFPKDKQLTCWVIKAEPYRAVLQNLSGNLFPFLCIINAGLFVSFLIAFFKLYCVRWYVHRIEDPDSAPNTVKREWV